jgi:hypothetical protein
MSDSNTTVNITSDGSVITYNEHGVRNYNLSGTLPVLHVIVKLNKISGVEKRKLRDEYRIRHAIFYFLREDIGEAIQLPIQHVMELIKYINKGDSEQIIESLLLQIPPEK